MSKKLFGTDGVRGIANEGNITAPLALKLGSAAATLFTKGEHRHLVVIGKDTRLSGYLLEPALTSGFISAGMDVLLVGPMPTPAISMLTKSLRADLGIMISASHNPYQYNGIKIFDSKGEKLSEDLENKIEDLINDYPNNIIFAKPEKLGRAYRLDDAPGRYVEFAKNTFPKYINLYGVKIVIDSANGAAYHIAHKIFWELGADVIHIGNAPNGFNINKNFGSTDTRALAAKVIETKSNLGVALDGDADRLILVDEKGNVIDGDQIIATIANYMKAKNILKNNSVVCTHMSNIALENFLNSQEIKVFRTDVGDKHVYKKLLEVGANLGGEQSGHVILNEFSSTGDGIVAALQVLANYVESNYIPISKLCNKFNRIPQIMKNVSCSAEQLENFNEKKIISKIDEIESKLDKNSRLIVRKSGTEPLVRIMVESLNIKRAKEIISEIEMSVLGLV